MDELPTDFDIIVIGTGMAESVVAAAASRIGKKVLHLDSSDYYGGLWASFNLEAIQKIIDDSSVKNEKTLNGIFNVEQFWHIEKNKPVISVEEPVEIENQTDVKDLSENTSPIVDKEEIDNNLKQIPETSKIEEAKLWTQETLMKEYRRFNIDLAPKLLFARGELVELLISSNIARYAEFRCVTRVLTWIDESIQPVPCSRADVFATKNVSVVEKRMLMKLLTSFLEFDSNNVSEEFKGFENKTLLDYLKSKKITKNLIHYVMYAIAGASDNSSCYEGVESSKRFLVSLGRYGNTPFLWSMYGCGELPQCFCRLCAVFGGVYCLNRSIEKVKLNENTDDKSKTIIITSNGKELYCEHVILGVDRTPDDLLVTKDFSHGISRGIFVTNKSILEEQSKEPLTLLRFPPLIGKENPVTAIELGPCTSSCPKGLYLVHMTCAQNSTARDDLIEYAEKIFSLEKQESVAMNEKGDQLSKPKVLWSLYFNMIDTNDHEKIQSISDNIHITNGPDIDLDFDRAVKQGREIFLTIYPNQEFLPRAPDPEEIIFEGDDADAGPEFQKDESLEKSKPEVEKDLKESNEETVVAENVINEQEVVNNETDSK